MVGFDGPGGLFQLWDSIKCCAGSLERPKKLSEGFTGELKEQREKWECSWPQQPCFGSPVSSLLGRKEGMEPECPG